MPYYDEISVGDSATAAKVISADDIYTFAGITGDSNPAHVDEDWARESLFGARIAHGMLVASLISRVLGVELPGPGTIYLSQSVKFLKPVFFDDTVTARVEVTEKREKNRLVLRTTCHNQHGDIVINGEALVLPPRR